MSEENTPKFGQSTDDVFNEDKVVEKPTAPKEEPVVKETKVQEEKEVTQEKEAYHEGKNFARESDEVVEKPVEKQELSKEDIRKASLASVVLGQDTHAEDLKDDDTTYAKVEEIIHPYKYMEKDKWLKLVQEKADGDIVIPSITPKKFLEVLRERPILELSTSDDDMLVFELVKHSYRLLPRANSYQATIEDSSREFSQELDTDTTKLRAGVPKIASSSNTKLKGEAAVIRLKQLMGEGGLFNIPLYHSGFWVTLKNPSDSRLIDLEHEINRGKVLLGRNLNGAIFANERVHIAESIMRLFNDCLYNTSLQTGATDINKKIKIQDLDTIAWGIACTIWPDGYPFSRVVVSKSGYDDKTIHGKVDLTKLQWVDRTAFDEKQKRHMTKRNQGSMSDTSIDDYQDSLSKKLEKRIELRENLYCIINSPSVADYLSHGEKWVDSCIQGVDDILAEDNKDDSRDEMIISFSKANIIGQYRHYIKSFIFVNPDTHEEEIYDDDETVDRMVEQFSGQETIRTKFLKEIFDFIDQSPVSIIATPTVEDEDESVITNPRFPNLVPMDTLLTFFTLAMQRVQRIEGRGSLRT